MMTEGKVLLLTFEFPPHPGGIGTYAYQIAANFHAMRAPVVVLARSSKEAYQDDATFDQIQLFPIYRFRRWKFRPLIVVGRIIETLLFCWRHRIKWIHCCSYKAAYGALACRFLLGVPYFLMGHGSDYAKSSKAKAFILKHALGLFANSNCTASLMHAQCERRVTVISLGADVEQFNPGTDVEQTRKTLCTKYGIQGYPVLLSVGRLNPRKGHDITLKALVQIKVEYPNVQFVIIGRSMVGEDEYETGLHSYINEVSLEENVG